MKPQLVVTLAFLTAISIPLVDAADWPTQRHDDRRSGATTEKVPTDGLAAAWVIQSRWPSFEQAIAYGLATPWLRSSSNNVANRLPPAMSMMLSALVFTQP